MSPVNATLDMVPLRTTLPTGHMTVRYSMPAFVAGAALPELDQLLGDMAATTSEHDTTTSKVLDVTDVEETATGKGGAAR